MKYIDAEHLRKEVKRLEKAAHKSALGCADSETRKFHEGKDFAYQHIGFLIDSLQHEQQEDLYADIEMEWDSFNKHLAKYGEESEDVVWLNWNSFNELARHFYELGLNARKEEKK